MFTLYALLDSDTSIGHVGVISPQGDVEGIYLTQREAQLRMDYLNRMLAHARSELRSV